LKIYLPTRIIFRVNHKELNFNFSYKLSTRVVRSENIEEVYVDSVIINIDLDCHMERVIER
jgi:hypothetical protein